MPRTVINSIISAVQMRMVLISDSSVVSHFDPSPFVAGQTAFYQAAWMISRFTKRLGA